MKTGVHMCSTVSHPCARHSAGVSGKTGACHMSTFELALPWWELVWRGIGAYLAALIMMRIVGKRSFGDMSTFDIIVLVLVGGTLRNSILGPDMSFPGGLIAVASILAADRILAWACTRSPWLK